MAETIFKHAIRNSSGHITVRNPTTGCFCFIANPNTVEKRRRESPHAYVEGSPELPIFGHHRDNCACPLRILNRELREANPEMWVHEYLQPVSEYFRVELNATAFPNGTTYHITQLQHWYRAVKYIIRYKIALGMEVPPKGEGTVEFQFLPGFEVDIEVPDLPQE